MSLSLPRSARPDGSGESSGCKLELEGIEKLPTLPEAITRILELIEDPQVSAVRVAEVVGRDQSVVSAILRLVNSPYYGLRSPVTSIQHAVILLGLRTVRNLALSAVLVRTFGESSSDRRFNRRLLWRHTVSTAVGARLLSRGREALDGEEAFLAGLLHDMGLVVLDQYFHKSFRQILDKVIGEGQDLLAAEREIAGLDHAAVGGLLAEKWSFPSAVIEAISCHHEPGRAFHHRELAAAVHLAPALADDEADGRPHQLWEDLPVDLAALETLAITPESFALLREDFREEWAKAQALLGLLS